MNKSTRDYSGRQEKHIAKVTGGTLTPNSGGTRFGGGDVLTDKFLIEAKTPTKSQTSFAIKREWIHKMYEQAFEQGKEETVLAFRFNPDANMDWYIISEKQFLEYLEWKENQ